MSMLDSFFAKVTFRGSQCKTLLKLTIPRIKLLRNRREIQLKQMRRDIAKLLQNGQEATARIQVEHIIREENTMAAQEILELFCELIAVRLPIIETQRECPLDLKEAISSICFAAPRCADLPELLQVQILLAAKYGKEFVTAATELMPNCGVNRQLIELLSVGVPSIGAKLKLLKEIAEEHELDWDPSASEAEFLKPHEDLLNGPNHFADASTFPLPKEKHEEKSESRSVAESYEDTDSGSGFDLNSLLRKDRAVSGQPTSDIPSAPEISKQAPPFSYSTDSKPDHGVSETTEPDENELGHASHKVEVYNPEKNVSVDTNEDEQFIPFVSPPSLSSHSVEQSEPTLLPPSTSSIPPLPKHGEQATSKTEQAQFVSETKFEDYKDLPPFSSSIYQDPNRSERATTESEQAQFVSETKDEANEDLPPSSFSHPLPPKQSEHASSKSEQVPLLSQPKNENYEDLQDVLDAAQAAAETAEKAATAARAAAELAQFRISDLVKKRNKDEFDRENSHQHNPSSYSDQNDVFKTKRVLDSPKDLHADAVPKMGGESQTWNEVMLENHQLSHVPQLFDSFDGDTNLPYPNLFTSQN